MVDVTAVGDGTADWSVSAVGVRWVFVMVMCVSPL
jgi:hypothetical protein